MRGALLLVLVLALAAPAAAQELSPALLAPESSRVQRLATDLRRGPLAVETDASWLLPADDRAQIERTLRAAEVPFFVAVATTISEDESDGDGRRLALTLSRRVGRPGVYVVVDQDGRFGVVTRDAPRRLGLFPESGLPDPGYGSVEALRIVPRLQAFVRRVEAAPPGRTSEGGDYLSRITPVHFPPDRPPSVASDLALAGFLGLLAALPVGLILRRRAR